MTTKLMIIRGKVVNYGPKAINVVFGVQDHDNKAFKEKDYEMGTWLESKVFPRKMFLGLLQKPTSYSLI